MSILSNATANFYVNIIKLYFNIILPPMPPLPKRSLTVYAFLDSSVRGTRPISTISFEHPKMLPDERKL